MLTLQKGEEVSTYFERVYAKYRSGEFTLVPPTAFNGIYAEPIHGFGFFPRIASKAQIALVQVLHDLIEKGEEGARRWLQDVKRLPKDFLFFAGEFESEIRIADDEYAWTYFAILNPNGHCQDACGLLDGECIGVITDTGMLVVEGPVAVVDGPRVQFDGFTNRMRDIRRSISEIRREVVHFSRPHAVARFSGSDFNPREVVSHQVEAGMIEDSLQEIPTTFDPDYTSLRARKL